MVFVIFSFNTSKPEHFIDYHTYRRSFSRELPTLLVYTVDMQDIWYQAENTTIIQFTLDEKKIAKEVYDYMSVLFYSHLKAWTYIKA